MRYEKQINVRLTSDDLIKITTLKEFKKAKNEVFNLSALIRRQVIMQLENIN